MPGGARQIITARHRRPWFSSPGRYLHRYSGLPLPVPFRPGRTKPASVQTNLHTPWSALAGPLPPLDPLLAGPLPPLDPLLLVSACPGYPSSRPVGGRDRKSVV